MLKTASEVKIQYPSVKNPELVGSYPAYSFSGGGFFYDEILEYRVWTHAPDDEPKVYSFSDYESALKFKKQDKYAEDPLVLILQKQYVDEPSENQYVLVRKPRVTEWQVDWLKGSESSEEKISSFLDSSKSSEN